MQSGGSLEEYDDDSIISDISSINSNLSLDSKME